MMAAGKHTGLCRLGPSLPSAGAVGEPASEGAQGELTQESSPPEAEKRKLRPREGTWWPGLALVSPIKA